MKLNKKWSHICDHTTKAVKAYFETWPKVNAVVALGDPASLLMDMPNGRVCLAIITGLMVLVRRQTPSGHPVLSLFGLPTSQRVQVNPVPYACFLLCIAGMKFGPLLKNSSYREKGGERAKFE